MKIMTCMTAGHGESCSQDRLLIFNSILASGEALFQWEKDIEGVVAIFDGVGGIQGGAYASDYAAKQMSSFPVNEESNILREYMASIATHLRECDNCATTATGIIWTQAKKVLFHIGNTRLYTYDGSFLNLITDDQTYVNDHLGELSDEEYNKVKNQITGCLGGTSERLFEKLVLRDITDLFENSKKVVLTCDGVHEYVDSFALLKKINNGESLRNIIEEAHKAGSDDDCSIMVIEL